MWGEGGLDLRACVRACSVCLSSPDIIARGLSMVGEGPEGCAGSEEAENFPPVH